MFFNLWKDRDKISHYTFSTSEYNTSILLYQTIDLVVDKFFFSFFIFQQAQHNATLVLLTEHGTRVLQWWFAPSRTCPGGFGIASEIVLFLVRLVIGSHYGGLIST